MGTATKDVAGDIGDRYHLYGTLAPLRTGSPMKRSRIVIQLAHSGAAIFVSNGTQLRGSDSSTVLDEYKIGI